MKVKGLYHKRHYDFEVFDEITMKTVPRYKTSELSGDEWRVSVLVELRFKGALVLSRSFRDMATAIRHLGAFTDQDVIPNNVLKIEERACDQPGCSNLAVVAYQLKDLYSERGHKLDPKDTTFSFYRKFCTLHQERGDCGREDADRNYEELTP